LAYTTALVMPPCRAQLTFKTVPRASFEDVDAFRRAWF
jgi:hypothetical protein